MGRPARDGGGRAGVVSIASLFLLLLPAETVRGKLGSFSMPPGLNYLNKAIEFWGTKIFKTTLQKTLDNINKKTTDKTALDQYRKTEFLLPTAKLVAQVRQYFTENKKLQPYTYRLPLLGVRPGAQARRDRGRKCPRIEREREDCLKSLRSFILRCNRFIKNKKNKKFTSYEGYALTPPIKRLKYQ